MAEAPSPGPAASPPRLRLTGVVAAEPGGPVLADVTMRADGDETPSGLWTRPFEIVLGNGDRVRVEAASEARLVAPEGSARGAWRDVEGHALARPFREKAPGPHVDVKLRGRAVSAGDPIEVLAEVIEQDTVDGPMGLRDSPPRRISAVRALVIAGGPDARATLSALCWEEMPALARPAKGEKRLSWRAALMILLVLIGLALLGKAIVASRSILFDLLSLVVVLIAWFYDLIKVDSETPRFRAGVEPKNDTERNGSMIVSLLGFLGVLICLVMDVVDALSGSEHTTHPVALLLGAGALSVRAISMLLATRYPMRMARLLTPAPAVVQRFIDGEWSVSTGIVEDPTPTTDTAEPAAMGVSTASEVPRLLHEGTFFVKSEAGEVEIEPRDAVWASAVKKTRTVAQGGETKTIVEEIVPLGAHVVFAGRPKRREGACPLLEATGPESLVLFAVPAGLDPVDVLRGLARARRIALCLEVGGTAALLALAALLP